MDFREFFVALSESEREAYALRAKTTALYISTHLIAPKERRRIPRPALMQRLAEASEGAVSHADLLAYFYGSGSSDPIVLAEAAR